MRHVSNPNFRGSPSLGLTPRNPNRGRPARGFLCAKTLKPRNDQGLARTAPLAAFRDDGIRSGPEDEDPLDARGAVCLPDDDVENLFDDLDALKERLSLVEEIERALTTIEARVDQLDSKLVGLCDSDMERSVLMKEFLQARKEEEAERTTRRTARKKTGEKKDGERPQHQPVFDTEILSHPFHLRKRDAKTTAPPPASISTSPSTEAAASSHALLRAHDEEQEKKRLKTERAWEDYHGSFTIILTKGYLQAVDNLRQRMMIQEYETNLMHVARKNGIARFEAFCAIKKEETITFAIMEQLYENPKDLSVIQDEHLRMRCQSLIRTEEMKMKEKCFHSCTEEARRLANIFSKTDFLAKVLPDPIEHGLVSSVETLMAWYQTSKMGGG